MAAKSDGEMTVFLDSNYFVALLNTRDNNHNQAMILLERLKDPTWGERLTTDYILDEVVTTIWSQTHRKELVKKAYNLIWNTPQFVRLQLLTKPQLELAYKKWIKLAEWPKRPLSYTDCTILSIMETQEITHLLSFDAEFDGLVPRIT